MGRTWTECERPDRDPDLSTAIDVPPEEGEALLVWYDEKYTITEVSGAHQNMGAYRCRGRVPLEVLRAEIEDELREEEDES